MPRDLKFPENCRGRILCSFGGHGAAWGHQRRLPISKDELRRTLTRKIRNYNDIQDFMLISLNRRQIPLFEEVLFEFKFRLVEEFRLGNRLYIRKFDPWEDYDVGG